MAGYDPPHPPPLPEPGGGLIDAPADSLLGSLRRNRHVTIPLLVPFAALAAAVAMRIADAGRDTVIAGAAVLVMTAFFARHKWDRPVEVFYAIASAAAATGWLAAVWVTGIQEPQLIALAVLALAWGIPYWRHKRPREKVDVAALIVEWDEWWQHHAPGWGLGGSKVVDVILKGPMETLVIQLWRGKQSYQQVETVQHLIESALDGYVRHKMIRVRVNPDNPSQAHIKLRRENPLAKSIEWDPSLLPPTITEPAPIGATESGDTILTSLLTNWFLIGRSRSGKSNELSELLATITGCPDALAWLIDRKGGRAARPWMRAVDWVATELAEIRLMLETADAEVRARAMHAYDGEEQLRPTRDVPAVFLIVDEAAEVTGINGEEYLARLLASVSAMGMGVAVYVIVLTQYGALEESVRTEQTRGNLINRMCFAVAHPSHGAFALTDYDRLDASRLEAQGEFYWQRGPKAASEPGRGHEMTHDLVRLIAERNSRIPRRPLRLYASGHQAGYDARWSRLPAAFIKLAPQAQAVTTAPPPVPQETPVHTQPRTDGDEMRADAEQRAQRIEDELAEAHASGRTEPPKVDDLAIRRTIGQQKAELARALQAAPEEGTSPAQLIKVTGMPRSTLNAHLTSLTSDGAVIKVGRGAYRAAAGVDVAEAMDKISQGSDRLLTGTRSA